ncbi:MAG: hypothetical protein ACK4LQ_02000 [Pararhodobacter sp.]
MPDDQAMKAGRLLGLVAWARRLPVRYNQASDAALLRISELHRMLAAVFRRWKRFDPKNLLK